MLMIISLRYKINKYEDKTDFEGFSHFLPISKICAMARKGFEEVINNAFIFYTKIPLILPYSC